MYLLGDLIQNIAIIGLMLAIYKLKKIIAMQHEVTRILCKWATQNR